MRRCIDINNKSVEDIASLLEKWSYLFLGFIIINITLTTTCYIYSSFDMISDIPRIAFVILFSLLFYLLRNISQSMENLKLLLFCKVVNGVLIRMHIGVTLYTIYSSYNFSLLCFQMISLCFLFGNMYLLIKLRWKILGSSLVKTHNEQNEIGKM